jgi:hypothetical protein
MSYLGRGLLRLLGGSILLGATLGLTAVVAIGTYKLLTDGMKTSQYENRNKP